MWALLPETEGYLMLAHHSPHQRNAYSRNKREKEATNGFNNERNVLSDMKLPLNISGFFLDDFHLRRINEFGH